MAKNIRENSLDTAAETSGKWADAELTVMILTDSNGF